MNNYGIPIGTQLYIRQEGKSPMETKTPYTVIGYTKTGILIQEAELIFEGTRYYNSIPVSVLPDDNGDIIELRWSDSINGGCWWSPKCSTSRDYPMVAHFGKYKYVPFLD